jgi:hypothetical protein
MTATQSLTRRAIGALRRLNDELLASGEAMARTARAPQPRPQAGPAGTTPAPPASAGTLLTTG